MTVLVIGSLRFPPESLAEVRPQLQRLVEATRRDDGCIAYDVGEDPFEPGLLRFSEIWPDRASLDRHLQAPHIAPWRAFCAGAGLIERRFSAFEAHEVEAV
jgi:quinol monooxygenase YgiN